RACLGTATPFWRAQYLAVGLCGSAGRVFAALYGRCCGGRRPAFGVGADGVWGGLDYWPLISGYGSPHSFFYGLDWLARASGERCASCALAAFGGFVW